MTAGIIESLGDGPIPSITLLKLLKSDNIHNVIPLTSRYSDPPLEEYIVQFVLSLDEKTVFAFHLDQESQSWNMIYDSRNSDAEAREAAEEAEDALRDAATEAGYDFNNLEK